MENMRIRGLTLVSAAAIAISSVGSMAPAHAAGPTLSSPESLVSTVATEGGSLTGSDPFTTAAFKTVLGPSNLAPTSFAVRWTYTNGDPVSDQTRIILSSLGHYECTSATFAQSSCNYIQKTRLTYNDVYWTTQVFFSTLADLAIGKYVFPSLTLLTKSGTPIESRSSIGYFIAPSNPSVNPATTSIGDQSAKTISVEEIARKRTANEGWGADFKQWSGVGAQTASRTIRVFDCPQAFESTTPPNQPSGCVTVREFQIRADLGAQGVPVNSHNWAAGRFLVATDTLALASPGLLTAHMRAATYQVVSTGTPSAPADPNDAAGAGAGGAGGGAGVPADPNAGGGAGNAGAGGGATVDPGLVALIGISPDVAPLVSEDGVGTRSSVTMTLQSPAATARGVKKTYRAILTPTTQTGKVVFTIARVKNDGTMKIIKKASTTVKKGKAAKKIVISRKVAKGSVRVFASYVPKKNATTGMTVSKSMLLK